MMKTPHWWSSLEAWQAVLVLASIYLIWWVIDRYYHRICGKIDAVNSGLEALQQRIAVEETNRKDDDQIYARQTVDACNDIRAKIKALDDKIGATRVKRIALSGISH